MIEENPKGESCETCGCCMKVGIHKEGLKAIYNCRAHPPTIAPMISGGQPITWIGTNRPVPADYWCAEWRPTPNPIVLQ